MSNIIIFITIEVALISSMESQRKANWGKFMKKFLIVYCVLYTLCLMGKKNNRSWQSWDLSFCFFFFSFICSAKTSGSSNVTFKAIILLIYFLRFFQMYTMWWFWPWVLEVAYPTKTLDEWISTLSWICPWRPAVRSWIKRGSFENKQVCSHRSSGCSDEVTAHPPEDITYPERGLCAANDCWKRNILYERWGLAELWGKICGVGTSVPPFALYFWWCFLALLRALALMGWFGNPVHLCACDVWSIGVSFSPTKVGTGGGGKYSKQFSRAQTV